MTRILTLIGLAAAAFGVWWFFLRSKSAASATGDQTGTGDAAEKWQPNCFSIPPNVPKYSDKPLPTETQAYLGFSSSEWTAELQDRTRGFFVAIDTEPSLFILKYIGKEKVLGYLNSPDGLFPSGIVLKGVLRCDNNRNRSGPKWGANTFV